MASARPIRSLLRSVALFEGQAVEFFNRRRKTGRQSRRCGFDREKRNDRLYSEVVAGSWDQAIERPITETEATTTKNIATNLRHTNGKFLSGDRLAERTGQSAR